MIFTPTAFKRNVVLAVKIEEFTNPSHRVGSNRITRICALFCDHVRMTEGLFDDDDEAALLLTFWRAVRSSDRFFSADVEKVLAIIRLRTWQLGLLPSAEIELRRVYGPDLHDTSEIFSKRR